MFNGTLRFVNVTVVAVEKQRILNIISVCLYPCLVVRLANLIFFFFFCAVLYCHLWAV
jgi:hypothetical protein